MTQSALLLIAPALWAATAFVGVTTIAWMVYRAIQSASSGWSFTAFLTTMPSVNLQTFVGLGLCVLVVVVLLTGAVVNAGTIFRVQFDYTIIDKILWTIQGLMGWNALKFGIKRATFKHGSPDDTRGPPARQRAKKRKRPAPVAAAPLDG